MLTDRAGLPPSERDALDRELRKLGMLADVVRWAFSLSPRRDVEDVVVQDAYTHDVLITWTGGRYLAFGTT